MQELAPAGSLQMPKQQNKQVIRRFCDQITFFKIGDARSCQKQQSISDTFLVFGMNNLEIRQRPAVIAHVCRKCREALGFYITSI
jgi:hypothetical protein